MGNGGNIDYVLITPAHNEASSIAETIESIASQTLLPQKWIIVNDASTDQTSEVVESYCRKLHYLSLVNVERPPGRHFSNKVNAFNVGLQQLTGVPFEFIGNLDADIAFAPDYFQQLLGKFEENTQLGLAGGRVHNFIEGRWVGQKTASDSVAGAVQLFRRSCFESFGGYRPLKHGGIDSAAEVAARFHGWVTETFPELKVLESRRTGWADGSSFRTWVKEGKKMYALGYLPAFYLARCASRVFERPMFLGSLAAAFSFLSCWVTGQSPDLSPDVVGYLRREQWHKLQQLTRLNRLFRRQTNF